MSRRRSDRVSAILTRVSGSGSIDAGALASEFGVSTATIRRDLQTLEDQKLLARTHGGAVATSPSSVLAEVPVRYRTGRHREAKARIAQRAFDLLPHGPLTLGLTGGTTTHLLARLLATRVDLTVVTNAVNIAAELALRPRLKLIMTGGVTRTQSYELVGPIADRTLNGLHLQVAVIGVDGITATGGLTTHDDIEAHTNATMLRRAAHVIVVADGSKIGRDCLATIAPLTGAVTLITDPSADEAALTAIQATGVRVVIA
ncbi:DeoR/GlpR family DNA-binding transcription regulator [Dactylosporangium sp. NPDC005555]|uniref:DeoR/GlpR family DNA-binding transcription regulator n=1 Tax=Dactylosporangium sp. NPDC005555 TaxID=3154889 RepID=UPI0033A8F0C1